MCLLAGIDLQLRRGYFLEQAEKTKAFSITGGEEGGNRENNPTRCFALIAGKQT